MRPHDNAPTTIWTSPDIACLDCGSRDRHADTCPQRADLLDLLDADTARLAGRRCEPFTRAMHRVERAHLEAMTGHRIPRAERGRWRVDVSLTADSGIRRVIRRDGRWVVEITDDEIGAGT